jgi:FKBP-type peptidyl-prolyl cis-trans isomerase
MATTAEKDSLQHYLGLNSISAIRDTSGVFYIITTPGFGTVKPDICSNVVVSYTGTLFNGTQFDATAAGQTTIFALGRVIVGWQKALPHLTAGGSITLYIPPSLAYASQVINDPNTGYTLVPANSYLKFTINLVDVQ